MLESVQVIIKNQFDCKGKSVGIVIADIKAG